MRFRTGPRHESHPTWQFRRRLSVAVLAVALSWPVGARAQVAEAPPDTALVVVDSSDLVSVARAAQQRFERRRHHHIPVTLGVGGGECDERVGRFCTWYGEGEWYPTPEAPEIVELRTELLAELDSLQTLVLGDDWMLGQRVWYRAEAGDWSDALSTARRCGEASRWWCEALEGFALHGLGRYEDADRAFERALDLMEPERAAEWREPRVAVDGDVRDLFDDADDDPDSLRAVIDRVWTLADPLYLVPGNDRLTAHYARWVTATVRERARNPFRIRWGWDLEALTVRHGWELGWERAPGRNLASLDHVIGHKHPEGRDYIPPGAAVADPARATRADFRADRTRPRSLYAPDYAPVLLPMEGQLAVFPRGGDMVLVSTHHLPDDTTFHSSHEHDLPWLDPGDQAGLPDRIGLFARPADGGPAKAHVVRGHAEGVLSLKVPTGDWVVSAEVWSPRRRRAGRTRVGVGGRAAPEDIATLSDLLLLRPLGEETTGPLEAVLDGTLTRPVVRPGERFAIGWEVVGLGFRPETLRFEVSVERADRGVFRRIGEFLRLAERPRPLTLAWEEPAPDEPRPHFRSLDLDIPELEEGRYRIRLTLRTGGRSDAVTETTLEVRRTP